MKLLIANQHLTDREIAKLLGTTRIRVYSFRRRNKIMKDHATFSQIGANMVKKQHP